MTAKRLTGTLAALAGVLAMADTASAASRTYCVEKPACEGLDRATFQAALNSAAAHGGPDRIELGPSTFLSHAGFDYSETGANTVEIVGMGADQTRLRTDPAAGDLATLVLNGGSISDLEILGPHSIGEDPDNKTLALELQGEGTHLRIVGGFTNVRLRKGATLSNSQLSEGGIPGYQRPSVLADDGDATLVDSTVESRGVASLATDSGRLAISRSRITAPWGVIAAEGGSAHVDNTLFRGVGSELYALTAYTQSGSAQLVARNVTVVGSGVTDGHGVAAVSDGGGTVASAIVENTILVGVPKSLARRTTAGSAQITVTHSAYDASRVEQSGGGILNTGEGNVGAPTDLVDFRLPPGSPLIDAGDSGGVGAVDLDGGARAVDGNGDGVAVPDIGAFEFVPGAEPVVPPAGAPPVAAPAAPKLSKLSLTRRKFRVAGRRRGTVVRFRLDSVATVRLRVLTVKGRRVGTLVRAGRSGPNRLRFKGRVGRRLLRPGRYVVRAQATNAAGLRSARRSVKFRILR
jgi:hypothetical protein